MNQGQAPPAQQQPPAGAQPNNAGAQPNNNNNAAPQHPAGGQPNNNNQQPGTYQQRFSNDALDRFNGNYTSLTQPFATGAGTATQQELFDAISSVRDNLV